MTDSKYFTTTKKGEIFELKSELNSDKKEKKKEAVKKVIASMTVGKDVSALFPDVVNCMQTDNLELKKLVYLYLMNYAKSQPDMAIMAVNTFVKVSHLVSEFLASCMSKCLVMCMLLMNILYFQKLMSKGLATFTVIEGNMLLPNNNHASAK
jgi:vesicle coat complex subunit